MSPISSQGMLVVVSLVGGGVEMEGLEPQPVMSQEKSWLRTQHHLVEGQVMSQAAGAEALRVRAELAPFLLRSTFVPEWALGEGMDSSCRGLGPSPGHSQHAVSMRANNGCPFPVPMLLGVQPHLAQLSLFLAVLLTLCGSASQSKQGHSGGLAQADANAGLIAGDWPGSRVGPVCFPCLYSGVG